MKMTRPWGAPRKQDGEECEDKEVTTGRRAMRWRGVVMKDSKAMGADKKSPGGASGEGHDVEIHR